MLDLQRQRSSSQSLAGTSFASSFVAVHFFCGPLAATLLVFHQEFFVAVVVAAWFLFSVAIVVGMMNHQQWCRVLLSLWFFLAVLAGIAYLLLAPVPPPPSEVDTEPLPRALLPFWLSTLVFAYLSGAVVLLLSRRVERATMRGFRLWDKPRD